MVRSRGEYAAVVGTTIAALCFVLAGVALCPPPSSVTHSFSGYVWTTGIPACSYCNRVPGPSFYIAYGLEATLRWTDLSGGLVELEFVWDGGAALGCGAPGLMGQCQFWSTGTDYYLRAGDAVNQSAQNVTFTLQY